jgi:hypothetical protein
MKRLQIFWLALQYLYSMHGLCSRKRQCFLLTKNKPQGGLWRGESCRTCVSPGGAFRNTPLCHRHGNAIQIRHLMFCDTVWRLISRFPSPRSLRQVLLCRSYLPLSGESMTPYQHQQRRVRHFTATFFERSGDKESTQWELTHIMLQRCVLSADMNVCKRCIDHDYVVGYKINSVGTIRDL